MSRCKHCKVKFPKEEAHRRIHPECIEPWMVIFREKQKAKAIAARNAELRAEKAEIRKRKEANRAIPTLLRFAQSEFNKFIRSRDHEQPCISCGKPPPDLSGLHAGRDAGHYRSIGAAKHLRFHEDNVHAQCVHCNQYKSGNAVDYRIGLVSRIGVERVEALESDNTVKKWTREELIQITATYKAKRKELEKERE